MVIQMAEDKSINKLVLAFVAVLVGIALIGPINSSAISANVTGVTATIVSLIPTLFAIGVLVGVVKGML